MKRRFIEDREDYDLYGFKIKKKKQTKEEREEEIKRKKRIKELTAIYVEKYMEKVKEDTTPEEFLYKIAPTISFS